MPEQATGNASTSKPGAPVITTYRTTDAGAKSTAQPSAIVEAEALVPAKAAATE